MNDYKYLTVHSLTFTKVNEDGDIPIENIEKEITNKTKVVAKLADPTFNANRQGTIKITGTSNKHAMLKNPDEVAIQNFEFAANKISNFLNLPKILL